MNFTLVCRLYDYVPAGVFGVGISPRFVFPLQDNWLSQKLYGSSKSVPAVAVRYLHRSLVIVDRAG